MSDDDAEAVHLDGFLAFEVGVPRTIGWGIAVLSPDGTLTRTCLGCGVSATTPVSDAGEVEQARIRHAAGCEVLQKILRGERA